MSVKFMNNVFKKDLYRYYGTFPYRGRAYGRRRGIKGVLSMRVVFMGTPDIAATCLEKILADGFDVVGVYSQPDRPKGRGMKMIFSPVKEVALAENIPVFQPENFKSQETIEQFRALKPDICAVVAYGRMLPQSILDTPTCGCVNIHASLLPQYRGSAPYQWAVLNGEKVTGVTAMYLCREMDAGDIIDTAKTPIDPDNHDWADEGEVTAATCKAEGKIVYACENDGCTETKTEILPVDPEGHVWDEGEPYKIHSCNSAAYMKYTCTLCKEVKQGVI